MSDREQKIIVALDTGSHREALNWVEALKGRVRYFKVGLELFTASGPDVIRRIQALGGEVFLDLKLYDIPNTVGAAVRQATRLGVSFLTLHAYGGPVMIQFARQAADDEAKKIGRMPPKLLGVTVLTSQAAVNDAAGSAAPFPGLNLEKMVVLMAGIAEREGLDGVVASAREAAAIRQQCQPGFLIVTPGIRLPDEAVGDQKRVTTPNEAVRAGADYLVVGRPITRASDPSLALSQILENIE